MPGSLRTYAFINAKLKTRISGILTDAFYRNMVRTQTLNEAVSQLAGTPYEELVRIYNETGDLKMCELSLYRQEIGLYWEVERHVKDSVLAFVQALSTRYEIYNLKNALRIWFDRSVRHRNVALEASYLCRDRVHFAIDFDAVVAAENLEEIAELLGGTPYGRIVADGAGQVATAGSLFPVEVALDHHYFAQVFQATEQLPARDAEIARRMIGVEVDLQNVSWLARMRRFYKLESDRLQEVIIPHGLNLELSMLRQDNGDKEPVDLLLDLVPRQEPEGQVALGQAPAVRHVAGDGRRRRSPSPRGHVPRRAGPGVDRSRSGRGGGTAGRDRRQPGAEGARAEHRGAERDRR